jgi:tetratricopeptide (TPR) repeat protein
VSVASSPRIDPTIALQIDRLATAVAKDPRSKEFVPLADEYMKADMWQEAAAVLEDGLKAYPGFVTAMAALGRVYDQLGQPVKAKIILEEVVKQRPDNLRGHRILAKLYQAEGKGDLALRSCAVILSANASDEEALAIKRSITGNPDERPQSKRDKKRMGRETTAVAVKQSAPPLTISAPCTPASTLSMEATPELPRMKYAATIARLEAWLRTIQSHRETDSHRV